MAVDGDRDDVRPISAYAVSDFRDLQTAEDVQRARLELLDAADRWHAHHIATGQAADWRRWRDLVAAAITRRATELGLERP